MKLKSFTKRQFIDMFLKECIESSKEVIKARCLLLAKSHWNLYVIELKLEDMQLCIQKCTTPMYFFCSIKKIGQKEVTYISESLTDEEFTALHFAYLTGKERPWYLKNLDNSRFPQPAKIINQQQEDLNARKPRKRNFWVWCFIFSQSIALFSVMQFIKIEYWFVLYIIGIWAASFLIFAVTFLVYHLFECKTNK